MHQSISQAARIGVMSMMLWCSCFLQTVQSRLGVVTDAIMVSRAIRYYNYDVYIYYSKGFILRNDSLLSVILAPIGAASSVACKIRILPELR